MRGANEYTDPQYQDLVVAPVIPSLSRIHSVDLFAAELAAYLADRAEDRMYATRDQLDEFEAARIDHRTALRGIWKSIVASSAFREDERP